MPTYRVEVQDKDGEKLGEFENYSGLIFSKKLNNFGMCQFQVPFNDEKLEELSALRTYEVLIYRDDTLVWAGEQAHRNGTLEANSAKMVTITSYDFIELFNARYTGSSRVFDQVDAGTIASTLISESQAQTNGDFGVTIGTIEATVDRDRKYYNANIMEAIIRLSEVINGFDFEITNDKVFNVFVQKGSDLSASTVFEWGTNMERVVIDEDFTRPGNRAIVLGEGFDASQLRVERDDVSSQEALKLREILANESTVSDTDTLDDKGDAIIRKYKQPLLSLGMNQEATTTPKFGSLVVGDRVKVKIQEGVYRINNVFRIYGYQVAFSDDGKEAVSYELGLL